MPSGKKSAKIINPADISKYQRLALINLFGYATRA